MSSVDGCSFPSKLFSLVLQDFGSRQLAQTRQQAGGLLTQLRALVVRAQGGITLGPA